MVVCQYFLRGVCRFGNDCRNEHPRSAQSFGNQSWNNASVPILPFNQQSMQDDLNKDTPNWRLSSYGPAKYEPTLISGLDESPEELRVRAYQTANKTEYVQYEMNKIATAEQALQHARDHLPEAHQRASSQSSRSQRTSTVAPGGSMPQPTSAFPPTTTTSQQPGFGQSGFTQTPSAFGAPQSLPKSAFGGGTDRPAFGQSSFGQSGFGQSSFGQTAFGQSGFGQAQQSKSAASGSGSGFGAFAGMGTGSLAQAAVAAAAQQQQQQQQPVSAAGQPQQQPSSAFGSQQPASVFGQAQQPLSVFGQPQPPTSPFGQPRQQTTSVFGQTQQQPTSVFGATQQQPASTFGQPQQAPSVFGQVQQQQPTTSIFGTSQQQPTSAFGSSPSAFGTGPGAGTGFNVQPPSQSQPASQPSEQPLSFAQPPPQSEPPPFSSSSTVSMASPSTANTFSHFQSTAKFSPVTQSPVHPGLEPPPTSGAAIPPTTSLQSEWNALLNGSASMMRGVQHVSQYDSLLPEGYATSLPKKWMKAFEGMKFEFGQVPDSVPPLEMR